MWIDLDALIMINFEHRVLRIERTTVLPEMALPLYKDVLVGVLNLHRDKNRQARTGERC